MKPNRLEQVKCSRIVLGKYHASFSDGTGYLIELFFNSNSGGWGVVSNWIHSAARPPIGVSYLPRVIMMMEKLVEWWLARETEVLGEHLPQSTLSTTNPTWPDRTRPRAAAVGIQRLTPWAMVRPYLIEIYHGFRHTGFECHGNTI
jgi:hypothetical protein